MCTWGYLEELNFTGGGGDWGIWVFGEIGGEGFISENLFVFNIKFCTAINIEVFVELNSGLSDFNPFSSISYFLDLLKLIKLGMKYSTWLNKI